MGEPKTSALTRRVKLVKLEARLDVVDADQRLRLRKPSLRPPELLDREWPFQREGSSSLTSIVGEWSLKGSSWTAVGSRVAASTIGRAAGRSDGGRGSVVEVEGKVV